MFKHWLSHPSFSLIFNPPDISVHNQAYYKLYIMAEIDNRYNLFHKQGLHYLACDDPNKVKLYSIVSFHVFRKLHFTKFDLQEFNSGTIPVNSCLPKTRFPCCRPSLAPHTLIFQLLSSPLVTLLSLPEPLTA